MVYKNKVFCYILILAGIFYLVSCKINSSQNSVKHNTGGYNFDTLLIEHFSINSSVRAIFPLDENTCWYAGSDGQFGFTVDGGKTWNIDSLQHPDQPNLAFRSIAIAGNSVFLLSIASPTLLFKSDDWGKNWKVVYKENDSLAFYDAMAFWDKNEGIAMGDPTDGCLSVIKTGDGGNTWHKISCTFLPPSLEGEAAFAASNSNLALYGDKVWMVSGGRAARVFCSSDRGENWEVYNTPIVQGDQMTGIFSVDFYDANIGAIIGGDWNKKHKNTSNKALTRDGGKTWELVAEGAEPGYRSCIQFLDEKSANHLLAVGIPGISYSADLGATWIKIANESFYTFRNTGRVIWLAGNQKIGRWPIQ
jgi:photosystem II stability/assembly factor-like uncharacterized protein